MLPLLMSRIRRAGPRALSLRVFPAGALLSGALLTFATIAREFSSTVILYSGATRTLPVEVFAQVLQGNFASASVVGTVLIAVSLVPIVILFRFMARDEDVLL